MGEDDCSTSRRLAGPKGCGTRRLGGGCPSRGGPWTQSRLSTRRGPHVADRTEPPMTATLLARPAAGHGLSDATLAGQDERLSIPSYDRSRLRPGVVHIGLGSFHRAHQAVYFDDLARHRVSAGWGITGVSLRRPGVRDALAAQDGLYTVLVRDRGGESARVVGAVRQALFAPVERARVLSALADPRTRLVTLTITGDGYRTDDPGSEADLRHPQRPEGVFGYLVEGLARRRAAGAPPFTVLSCDNIAGNGEASRSAVSAYAGRRDDVLARWIERNVAFPSSMVDRITPRPTPADRAHLARRFGVDDRSPVVTEAFSQWVVEDAFCHGRPPLEEVGVRFTSDVAPFRLVKTRLLNGTHSALGYLGTLAGHRDTHEAMTDPRIGCYVERLMEEEIAPLLPPVPGLDLAAYRRTLLARLANPEIADPLARLCARGSTKVPAYLLPSLADALAGRRPHALLALGVAAWLRHLRDTPADAADPRHQRLRALVVAGGDDPRPVLAERDVFGAVGRDPACVAAVAAALHELDRLAPAPMPALAVAA